MSLVTDGIPDEADLAALPIVTGPCYVCHTPVPAMKGFGNFCSDACEEEARRIEVEVFAGRQADQQPKSEVSGA